MYCIDSPGFNLLDSVQPNFDRSLFRSCFVKTSFPFLLWVSLLDVPVEQQYQVQPGLSLF